jgi:molybdopterin-guanine dinucleotide biosynthesis protein A
MTRSYDAIVLAGGRARRMGGEDKTRLMVGAQSVLDRVLDAVGSAGVVAVVGEPRPVNRPNLVWCREEPPGSGPAAAVAAGLPKLRSQLAVLLAGDLPLLTSNLVERLVDAVRADGAVAVDRDGRPQWLTSAWRVSALAGCGLRSDGSLAAPLGALRWDPVDAPEGPALLDCDTPADLERARSLLR